LALHNRARFTNGDATYFAERSIQEFALRREPMSVGMSVWTAALGPKLIGAFAN
jgi:hypothetical protein